MVAALDDETVSSGMSDEDPSSEEGFEMSAETSADETAPAEAEAVDEPVAMSPADEAPVEAAEPEPVQDGPVSRVSDEAPAEPEAPVEAPAEAEPVLPVAAPVAEVPAVAAPREVMAAVREVIAEAREVAAAPREPVASAAPAGEAETSSSAPGELPLAAMQGIFELNARLLAFVQGVGQAAVSFWQSVLAARTPADVVTLQAAEMSRAVDAALACWSAAARRAGHLMSRAPGVSRAA